MPDELPPLEGGQILRVILNGLVQERLGREGCRTLLLGNEYDLVMPWIRILFELVSMHVLHDHCQASFPLVEVSGGTEFSMSNQLYAAFAPRRNPPGPHPVISLLCNDCLLPQQEATLRVLSEHLQNAKDAVQGLPNAVQRILVDVRMHSGGVYTCVENSGTLTPGNLEAIVTPFLSTKLGDSQATGRMGSGSLVGLSFLERVVYSYTNTTGGTWNCLCMTPVRETANNRVVDVALQQGQAPGEHSAKESGARTRVEAFFTSMGKEEDALSLCILKKTCQQLYRPVLRGISLAWETQAPEALGLHSYAVLHEAPGVVSIRHMPEAPSVLCVNGFPCRSLDPPLEDDVPPFNQTTLPINRHLLVDLVQSVEPVQHRDNVLQRVRHCCPALFAAVQWHVITGAYLGVLRRARNNPRDAGTILFQYDQNASRTLVTRWPKPVSVHQRHKIATALLDGSIADLVESNYLLTCWHPTDGMHTIAHHIPDLARRIDLIPEKEYGSNQELEVFLAKLRKVADNEGDDAYELARLWLLNHVKVAMRIVEVSSAPPVDVGKTSHECTELVTRLTNAVLIPFLQSATVAVPAAALHGLAVRLLRPNFGTTAASVACRPTGRTELNIRCTPAYLSWLHKMSATVVLASDPVPGEHMLRFDVEFIDVLLHELEHLRQHNEFGDDNRNHAPAIPVGPGRKERSFLVCIEFLRSLLVDHDVVIMQTWIRAGRRLLYADNPDATHTIVQQCHRLFVGTPPPATALLYDIPDVFGISEV